MGVKAGGSPSVEWLGDSFCEGLWEIRFGEIFQNIGLDLESSFPKSE